MTAIEDLQAPHSHPFAPLCIKVEFLLVKDADLQSFLADEYLIPYIHDRIREIILMLNKQMPLKHWMTHELECNKLNAV